MPGGADDGGGGTAREGPLHGRGGVGDLVATFQGTLVFLFAPLVGVTLTPGLVLAMWPVMFVGAFAMSSFAVDALRRLVLEAQGIPARLEGELGDLGLGIEIGGHLMSVWESALVVAAFGLAMNVLAMWLVSLKD